MNVSPVSDPGSSQAVHYGGGTGFFCPGVHVVFCNLGCCSPPFRTTWSELEPVASLPTFLLQHQPWDCELRIHGRLSGGLGYDDEEPMPNLLSSFNGDLANYCGSAPYPSSMGDFIIDTASFPPVSESPDAVLDAAEDVSENRLTRPEPDGIRSFDFSAIAEMDFALVPDDQDTDSFSPNPVVPRQSLAVQSPTPMDSPSYVCSTCSRHCKSRRDLRFDNPSTPTSSECSFILGSIGVATISLSSAQR